MPNTTTALTAAGETYFADLGRVRASGGATGERSSYGPLATLLNAVGATLAPKVFCVGELADHAPADAVGFRHLWGQAKRADLTATAEDEPGALYEEIAPILSLGLPFVRTAVSEDWFDWPALPDLFPVSFPGVKTSRDGFLVDVDLARLQARVRDYFDPDVSHEEIARRYPGVIKATAGFNARKVRDALLARGGPNDGGFVRFAYRPFDTRWLYWEADGSLLDRPRPDYRPHVFEGNLWLSEVPRLRRDAADPQAVVTSDLAALHLIEWSASMFPVWLRDDGLGTEGVEGARRQNLSAKAQRYLDRLGVGVKDLFHHVLATLHDPAYRKTNTGALRMEWPRIPLLGWPDGEADEAPTALAASAARGRALAQLLDSATSVRGVTEGTLRQEIAALAVPTTLDGHHMTGDDFALTAGWGHHGSGDAVMPGQGRLVGRPYTPEERAAMGNGLPVLGETTFDIYLNTRAFWRNIPAQVWTYKLGGYQVLKKWLSYREARFLVAC